MITDMHFCMRQITTSARLQATDLSLVEFTTGKSLQTLELNMSLRSASHHNRHLMLIHHFLIMNLDLHTTDWDSSGIQTTHLANHMESSLKRKERLVFCLT